MMSADRHNAPSPPLPPPPVHTDDEQPSQSNTRNITNHSTAFSRPVITSAMGCLPTSYSNTVAKLPAPQTRKTAPEKESQRSQKTKEREKPSTTDLKDDDKFRMTRKPTNVFISQLYFLFHISLTLCLLKGSGKDHDMQTNSSLKRTHQQSLENFHCPWLLTMRSRHSTLHTCLVHLWFFS